MINLKLAQYNEKGEFEKFLEIGKDFAFAGEFILYYHTRAQGNFILPKDVLYKQQIEQNKLNFKAAKYKFIEEKEESTFVGCRFEKDEKDPFNRFNGKFNKRTYGNGRFVLVEYKTFALGELTMSQDDIFTYNQYTQKACSFDNFHYWQETEDAYNIDKECGYGKFKILGNIHENPELWSK